jgi:aerobic-type carbon monoxide dehydrogenase small subunit (CoxS/CutS family)
MTVNGKEVNPTSGTLIALLHQTLGLPGTQFGCGSNSCGACTVLVDGEPVHACSMPVENLAKSDVVTIEGLATGRKLHPLQEAFLARGALQCGYCTPGIILGAVALLARQPDPTPELIRRELNGHICHCGAYPQIVEAILSVSNKRSGGSTNPLIP